MRYADYGWIIDVDHDADNDEPLATNSNAVGLTGPRNINPEDQQALKNGGGRRFRMYDDDGELVYEGRFIGDSEGDDGFGPLDDFGAPNYGCTSIQYYRGSHTELVTIEDWETL